MAVPPDDAASFAQSQPFFEGRDLAAIAASVGLDPVATADLDAIASDLDDAAAILILGLRAATAATAGQRKKWARSIEKAAHALLDAFEIEEDQEKMLEPQLRAANILLAGVSIAPRRSDSTRCFLTAAGWPGHGGPFHVVRDTGEILFEPDALWAALLGVRVLAERAGGAAVGYKSKLQQRNPAMALAETDFVARLAITFHALFARKATFTNDEAVNQRRGAFLDFGRAVVGLIKDRLDDPMPERDKILHRRLDDLQGHHALAERLRDSRRWERGPPSATKKPLGGAVLMGRKEKTARR